MKKSLIVLFLAVLALSLVAPVQMQAGTPAPRATAKPKATPHTPVTISSVDASSITVSDGSKSTTYKINSFTEIQYKGNTAKVTDLQKGMRVSVTAGMDPTVADRISAEDAPPKTGK